MILLPDQWRVLPQLLRPGKVLLPFFVGAVVTFAQPVPMPPAVIPPAELNQLCSRVVTLMEAGGVAIPDLQRASTPVIENTKGACQLAQIRPNRSEPSYSIVSNLRAYLALSDAVAKPYPFSDAAQKQFAELRDNAIRLDAHFRGLLEFNDRRLTPADPANLARYAEANRKAGQPNASNPRVVFFGDSITDFWRLNEYFPEKDYLNRGISGQTTGEMLQRMRQDVIELKPQVVLILAGTNDLARSVSIQAIEDNYQALADLATANKIKPIFGSVLPVSDYHKAADPNFERTPGRPLASIRVLNDWLRSFCAKNGYGYVDYHSAMADGSGQLKEELEDDGLHPNGKGYRTMGPLAAAAIEKAIPPAAGPPAAKPKRRLVPSF